MPFRLSAKTATASAAAAMQPGRSFPWSLMRLPDTCHSAYVHAHVLATCRARRFMATAHSSSA